MLVHTSNISRIVKDIEVAAEIAEEEFPGNVGWRFALWMLRKTHLMGEATFQARRVALEEDSMEVDQLFDDENEGPKEEDQPHEIVDPEFLLDMDDEENV